MLAQKLPLDMMQTQWAQELNPIIANPMTNPLILKNISLVAGTNVINHRLGRNLQGWNSTRVRAAATIHDEQDTNQTPQLTLILVASAPVVVDLAVF
jgi:hypothetical protein